MAVLVPEFISVLRNIRDTLYPDIVVKHGEVASDKASVDASEIVCTTKASEANVSAIASALSASQSATSADEAEFFCFTDWKYRKQSYIYRYFN